MEDHSPRNLPPLPKRTVDRDLRSFFGSFGFAFTGLWYMLRNQRNAQVHLLIGACAVALGAVLGLDRWEWTVLIITIGVVMAAEGFNTAIESVVDLATDQLHPHARAAKDVGAGAVLVCAVTSVMVGCLIFIPHLLRWMTP